MTDTLRRLSPIGWMFRKSLFGLLGWALVTVALDLLKPWPVQLAVDHVLPGKPLPGWAEWLHLFPGAPQREWLLAWTAVLSIIVLLLWWLARSAESYLQIGVGSRMTLETGRLLYDHLARVSLGFHQTNRVGDLTKRIVADSKCAKELWIDVALLMAISLATLIGMFTVLWRLNPALTLLAILSAPLIVCVVKLFAKPMSERSYAELELQGEMSAHAEQTLTALPVVQAFGREDEHDRSFRGLTERTGSAYLKAVLAQLQFGFGVSSVSAVATAAIFGLGGFFVLEGQLTVGELLVFLSYLAALLDPLETLAYLGTSYASASAGAKRVFSLIESEPVLESAPGSAFATLPSVTIRGGPY